MEEIMSSNVISNYKNILLNISRDSDIKELKKRLKIFNNLSLTNFLIDYIYEEINRPSNELNNSEKKSIEKAYIFLSNIIMEHNFDCKEVVIRLKKLRLLIEDKMFGIRTEEDGSLSVYDNGDKEFWSSIDACNSKLIRLSKKKEDSKSNCSEFERTLNDLIFKIHNPNIIECFIKNFSKKDLFISKNYSSLIEKILNHYTNILMDENTSIREIVYFDSVIDIILSNDLFKIDQSKLDIISKTIRKMSIISFSDKEIFDQRMIFLNHLKKKISNIENYVDSINELDKKYNTYVKSNIKDDLLSCINSNAIYSDFTDKNILICDSNGATVYDDGISIEKLSNGNYKIISYVTDVSYHIKFNSAIDSYALNFGSSIYSDKSYGYLIRPMLPKELLNEKCSLIPGIKRQALACIIELEPDGNIINHHFKMVTILPKREFSMSFGEADYILQNEKNDSLVASTLYSLRAIASKIEYKGKIKNNASGIVRRVMSLTNRLLTEDAYNKGFPIIYHNYGEPSCSEIIQHNPSLKMLEDIPLKNNLLNKIKGDIIYEAARPFYSIYPNANKHEKYAQMTSPMRRYADVMNGRMLKKGITTNWNIENREIYKIEELFTEIVDHLNTCELISNQYLNDYARVKK
jgi:hypothetical protein